MPYEFDSYERYEYHRNENYNSNGFILLKNFPLFQNYL